MHNASFVEDLEALLCNIEAALSEEAEKEHNGFIDKELLNNGLSGLKTALNTLNTAEINKAINILQDFTQVSDIGGSVSAILQNKLIGEYEEAISIIDTLTQKLKDEAL